MNNLTNPKTQFDLLNRLLTYELMIPLSTTDRMVLLTLAAATNAGHDWDTYVSQIRIARITGATKTTVSKAIKKLAHYNLITVYKRQGKNKYRLSVENLCHATRAIAKCPEGIWEVSSGGLYKEPNKDMNKDMNKAEASSASPHSSDTSETNQEDPMKGKSVGEIVEDSQDTINELKKISPEHYIEKYCLNPSGYFIAGKRETLWKFLCLKAEGDACAFHSSLTMKERGNLKTLHEHWEDTAFVEVLAAVILNWKSFTVVVEKDTGLPDPPATPKVWFVLTHRAIALKFTAGKIKKPDTTKHANTFDWMGKGDP
jgi:DNA-binding MarR family transcriptional regulator